MEDFPILLLFLIIYLVTASSGKKGKKKKRTPMRTTRERERADAQQMERDRKIAAGFETAFEHVQKRETHASCDVRPLHLHEVTQAQMNEAGEGEDPCHAGGNRADQGYEEHAYDDGYTLGQDVLRGVIMSEILTRPHERRAMHRNRQGYHG